MYEVHVAFYAIYVYIYMYVCIYVYIYIYMYMYIYILYVYVLYIYTYIYIYMQNKVYSFLEPMRLYIRIHLVHVVITMGIGIAGYHLFLMPVA